MATNYQTAYRQNDPIWLITITLPEMVLRFAYPEPLFEPYAIAMGSQTVQYFPGLVNFRPAVTHLLKGVGPAVALHFEIPSSYGVTDPITLDWSRATAEIAHWFEGETFANRRPLMLGRLTNIEVGAADETIDCLLSIPTQDSGRILDTQAIISGATFPDVENEPTSITATSTVTANGLTRERAYLSDGGWYGEIIGYPLWVEGRIVQNDINAEHSTATHYAGFRALLCDGRLVDQTSRPMLFFPTDRTIHRMEISDLPDAQFEATVDALGRPVMLVDLEFAFNLSSTSIFYPTGITTNKSKSVANLHNVKTWLNPGDQIKQSGDDDTYYRSVKDIESGNVDSSAYFGVALLDAEYGGLAVEEAGETVTVVPLPEEGSAYFDCSSKGGRPSLKDPHQVLFDSSDVLRTYLLRSPNIFVDFDGISKLFELDPYGISGHLIQGDISPLDWIRSELLPILPLVESWEGKGLTFNYLDFQQEKWVADLNVGKDGVDGDRIGKRPLVDVSDVYNDITLKYAYRPYTDRYDGFLITNTNATIDPQNTVLVGVSVVNSRAIQSQNKYGKRSKTISTKWIYTVDQARRYLNAMLNRFHKPRWRLTYHLNREWMWLGLNDIIRVTDSDIGLNNQLVRIVSISWLEQHLKVIVEEMG